VSRAAFGTDIIRPFFEPCGQRKEPPAGLESWTALYREAFLGGKDGGIKIVCQNRKARHLYHILEEIESGLVLTGTEVKSLRDGKASLPDSYAVVRSGEVYLLGAHIAEYTEGNRYNHDPLRERKLLLSRRQIGKLQNQVRDQGLTLVPLSIYFRDGWAKVNLALAKGKKVFDKREDIKKREAQRETERALRGRER